MFKIRYVSFIVSYYDFDRIVNMHRVACACHGLVLSIEGLCRKTYYKFIWNKNIFEIDKKLFYISYSHLHVDYIK